VKRSENQHKTQQQERTCKKKMNNKETLESFQSITGADEATARCFLESSNWNLEVPSSSLSFVNHTNTGCSQRAYVPTTTGGHQHFLRPRRGEPSSRGRHGPEGPLPRQERPQAEEDAPQERQRRRLADHVPSHPTHVFISFSIYYSYYWCVCVRVRSCVCGRDQWLMMAMVGGDGRWLMTQERRPKRRAREAQGGLPAPARAAGAVRAAREGAAGAGARRS
jgi:hypothetical protein